ncbi:MAG: O-antigen ligase family protein, partial [Lentisphaerae bacterium]|nr:O-antigen ligase family protein [Lentisphaerota bacterium]
MTKFYRYFVVCHVAALVIYTSWAFAGTRIAWLWPMFWLTLGVIEAMVLLPAMRAGETLDQARGRVVRTLVFDPLLAISVALIFFLVFQSFNGPRALVHAGESGGWRMGPPPLPGFPSSVVTWEAVQLLAWFPPALVAALAVRHAMDADGRRLLLRILIWNAAALALSGCVQMALGCRAIYGVIPIKAQFFSSFGYPNHAGAFFTFMLVVAGGFWLYEREDGAPGADRLLVAVFLLYCAAVLCLCRTSILMGTAVLLAGGAFAIARIWRRLELGPRVMVAGLSVLLPLLGYIGYFAFPGNPIRRELTGLTVVRLFTEVYERAFELLVPAAIAIWRDNPVFGVGGWGFRHFVPLVLTPEQYKKLFVGAANVHNDAVNFLVEHGVVGAALLALAGVTLLVPLLRRVPPPPRGHLYPICGSAGLFRWFVL